MKSKSLVKMVLFALLLPLVSCSEKEQSETTYMPFKSSAEGKWGLIGTDGTVLFEEEFKDRPTSVMNDRFMVQNGNGLWEVYTAESKPEKIGEEYLQIADFTADVTPSVKKNEKIKLIDVNGKEKVVLEKVGSKNIIRCSPFKFGHATITVEDDLCGIINTKGEVVVEPKYLRITPISGSKFLALEEPRDESSESGTLSVLEKGGKSVMSLKIGAKEKYADFDLLASTSEYLAICSSIDGDRQWGYINLSKDVVVKPTSKIRSLGEVKGNYFIFSDGENWGVMNFKGEVVLRPKYDHLTWADDDVLIAYDRDSKYSVINLEGDKITKDDYLDILPFYDGSHAAVRISDHSWGFINKKGEELKLKNVDIYYVGNTSACEYVESDFVDIDAIAAKLKLTKNGLMGYTLNMEPLQLIKVYNEMSDEKRELTPENNMWVSSLSTEQTSRGLDIYSKVSVGGEFVDREFGVALGWSKVKPYKIEARVGGFMINGKTDLLFDKLKATVKSFGKPMRENSRAIVVQMTEDQGWILICENNYIEIKLINDNDYQDYNIDYYAKSGETTRVYIEPKQSQNVEVDTDFIEEVDSVVAEY